MANILFGAEIEKTALQIALEPLLIQAEQRRAEEEGALTPSVRTLLGFKTDDAGNFIPLTDQERFDALSSTEQSIFNLFEDQVARLETAFAGDLPVSEALKQRSKDQFDVLKEELARRGQPLAGTNLETGVGFSTPAIQSLGERQRTQGLLEDVERRGEIDKGFGNVFQGAGLLSGLNTQQFQNLANAPKRFGVGTGGLLEGSGAADLFNAQQQNELLSGVGGLLGDVTKSFAAEWFKDIFK